MYSTITGSTVCEYQTTFEDWIYRYILVEHIRPAGLWNPGESFIAVQFTACKGRKRPSATVSLFFCHILFIVCTSSVAYPTLILNLLLPHRKEEVANSADRHSVRQY